MNKIKRRAVGVVAAIACLASCASFAYRDPVRVNLVGLEPAEGQGLELRFLARVRVQNANDLPIEFDGAALEVELAGKSFAAGVSDRKGAVPRFGEALVEIPVTVPAIAIVRQVLGVANGGALRTDYKLSGFINTPTAGKVRFESSGDIALPAGMGTK